MSSACSCAELTDHDKLAIDPSRLKSIPLFSSLSHEELTALCPAVQSRSYERKSLIVRAGAPGDGLYVLLAGSAAIFIENPDGDEFTVATIAPNEFFGETSVIDGSPRPASVKAVERCETVYISRSAFMKIFQGNFDVAQLMLSSVVSRLRNAVLKIEGLALMDVYGRVARVFVESAREVNGQWVVDTGMEEIGRLVAASREMVSRVVRDMREQGLVRKEKRKTVILDRDSIAEHVFGGRSAHGMSHDWPQTGARARIPVPLLDERRAGAGQAKHKLTSS